MKGRLYLYIVMFNNLGNIEWLIWFLIIGGIIIFVYMIIMHFVIKKINNNNELRIIFLEEIILENDKNLQKDLIDDYNKDARRCRSSSFYRGIE